MRRPLALLFCAAVLLAAAWRHQSELIGYGTGWYLRRVMAREAGSGDLGPRRDIVARTHRLLLMPAPMDAMIPELFTGVTELAQQSARGAMSLNWAAYIYSTYYQDLRRDRPLGTPPRTPEQVVRTIDDLVTFYAVTKRPNRPGVRVNDLLGRPADSYSLEEIERANQDGRQLPLH